MILKKFPDEVKKAVNIVKPRRNGNKVQIIIFKIALIPIGVILLNH
jgi:hypothetical protein